MTRKISKYCIASSYLGLHQVNDKSLELALRGLKGKTHFSEAGLLEKLGLERWIAFRDR